MEIKESNKPNKIKKTVRFIFGVAVQTLAYILVLFIVSKFFKKSINIAFHPVVKYWWLIITSLAIVGLNRTIKPALKYLTLPITALTFGLAYPLINVIILYLADILLGSKFDVISVKMIFVIAVIISILTYFANYLLLKIAKKVRLIK